MVSRPVDSAASDPLRAQLQRVWGYDDFRSPQREVVRCLLAQRDAIVVMPTGGGKSICFQLPALLQPGLTLVVSPLVALMENQVQELRQRRLPAALLHSELPRWQRKQTLQALEQNRLRLLYLSPETLLSVPVWERLCQPAVMLSGLVIDEAHCLTQWGESFRPAYYRLGAVRPALLQHKPAGSRLAIAAFTATADPTTQATLQRVLHLDQPEHFRLSPYRSNLRLQMQTVWTPRGRQQQLLKFIQAQGRQAGLVYVRSRRDSEGLAEWLTQQGNTTAAYHAGLSAEERRAIEQSWLNGALPFVVCTCAFGMGINHPTVRWIAHFHAPLLLSEYVQEIGRAGRDGKPATALILASEPTGLLDPQDKQRRQFFEQQSSKQARSAQHLLKKLPAHGDVASVSRQFPDGGLALSWLHAVDRLDWQDPFHYTLRSSSSPASLQSNIDAAQQMVQYLYTRGCRWKFLLEAFGFPQKADFRCGHCNQCNS
ncbi:ATP-dependent DNA helicase RecQ [Leptolyngbya sp. FACHB-36]|uniref:RecQ family ATP-dependent DNA helicase n=1 Tax=Leptolyngbya sp. FACHB-36 TaxID=2692808 RepID=UPI001680BDAC|nr:ATP-dependent DNA helicase RecQ [Leptolyngbya sp. FACHB-36]MBD2021172.1 ATP-dependent DNA helicase RecQ [Leptolyngbya sp. FACHB-36]